MATKEEIRGGIENLLEHYGIGTNAEYVSRRLVGYLHSQGAVIRVKCPDCSWYKFEDEVVGMTPCHSCDSTGYIVEPLIEDGKDNSGK